MQCEAFLPLRWRPRIGEERPCPQAALHAIEALEEPLPGREGPAHEEFLYLCRKFDVLIGLLAHWIAVVAPLPECKPCALRAEGIKWQEPSPPKTGETIVVEIFLHSRYLSPVVFLVRVEAVSAKEEGVWIESSFEGFEPEAREAWEKFLFRQHREAVRRAKASKAKD